MNECFVDNYDPFEWRRIAHILVKRLESSLNVKCRWGYDYTQRRIFINIKDARKEHSKQQLSFGDCGIIVHFYDKLYRNHPICPTLKLFISDVDFDTCTGNIICFTLSYASSTSCAAKIIEQYRIFIFRNIRYSKKRQELVYRPLHPKDMYESSYAHRLFACTKQDAPYDKNWFKKTWYYAACILRFIAKFPLEMILYIGEYTFSPPHVPQCDTRYICDGLSRFQDIGHNNKRRKIEK